MKFVIVGASQGSATNSNRMISLMGSGGGGMMYLSNKSANSNCMVGWGGRG